MAKRLVWVSNTPKDPRYVACLSGQSYKEAVESQIQWASQFVKGDPQATEAYSVADLKKGGYIGLYKEVEDEQT